MIESANNTTVAPWSIYEEVRFKPLGTNVLVIVEEQVRKTASGIILSSKDRDAALIARVVATGSEVKIDIKRGDRIVFERFSGTAMKATDKPAVLILDQSDIMAVLEPYHSKLCFWCAEAR